MTLRGTRQGQNLMRLGGGSISTGIPAACDSEFFQSIRRFDSRPGEWVQYSSSLADPFAMKMKTCLEYAFRSDVSPGRIVFDGHCSFIGQYHFSQSVYQIRFHRGQLHYLDSDSLHNPCGRFTVMLDFNLRSC
jgi:hypothetical protein